jgi:arylsulfatase A-like enzyme
VKPRTALVAIAAVIGCGRKVPAGDAPAGPPDAARPPTTSANPSAHSNVALDAVADFGACTLAYRGHVLDLGDASTRARYGDRLEQAPIETIEREGATWARIRSRSLVVSFYATPADLPADGGTAEATAYVEARIRGLGAKTLAIYLNGKLLGISPVHKGETKIVSARAATPMPLTHGDNEVLLRFAGAPRATSDASAEVDWIHVGIGDPDPLYAAPTHAESLVPARLAGEPVKALALRAPGFARCTGWLPAMGSVEASLGLEGGVEGAGEVRLVRDRADPVVLGTVRLTPEDATTGKHVSWPLGDVGDPKGVLGAIDFVALSVPKGGRVLFGKPRVLAPAARSSEEPLLSPARSVVLVVLGEVATRSLSLYGGPRPVPELSALGKTGIVFEGNRGATSLASGALASMLTGSRAVDDADARLPRSLTTIADAARQAGVATAMFTANPMTGAAFGFDRGWGAFVAHGPNEEAPATQVFDEAAQWIDAHKAERFLLVVHARGGHPPWDATPDELKALEPADYTGPLDAKHAAELLGRAHKIPGSLRFGDADRARAWALYALAIDAHDAALGRLIATARSSGIDADTAFIVTGDVSINEASHIPFADAETLDEASLWTPLVVRPAGNGFSAARVTAPTSSIDVARTVLGILGLEPPAAFGGVDLLETARGQVPPNGRSMVASTADRFAVRWDHYVLSGARARETKLCDLSLEPACVTDVRPTYPLALELLHCAAFDALVGGEARPPREPATIDAPTAAALRAWGR